MNHWKIFLTALFLTALVLNAIEVKTPSITAELSPDGAVITSLSVKGKRWLAAFKKNGSFTDRITQNAGPQTQGLAETAGIAFQIKEHTVSPRGTTVTFSSCIGVMPALRMEKSYFFSAKKANIIIDYRFTNIGSKPFPIGLYTRSFLRSSDAVNTYYHPGAKGFEAIMPGETSVPVKLPAVTALAVADKTGAGFIQRFPADDTAGVLNWLIKGGYTQEYLSSILTLQPGKTRHIRVECRFSDNVASDLKKSALSARKLKGELPVQVDRMCRIKPKAGLMFFRSIPTPQGTFFDCTFRRQFEDSWRAVELNGSGKELPTAVYPVENGVIALDKPLDFFHKGNTLVIKVPGVTHGRNIFPEQFSLKGDFVYNRVHKRWFGPVTMKCRIFTGVSAGREIKVPDIPEEGALIRNGSMEQISSKKSTVPAFMPYMETGNFKGGVQKESSGNKFLRIEKYAMFNFLPEHQKEYTLSLRARSVGGGGLSRIFIQFYDRSGKYLQKERLVVLASQKSFGWKKFERRFFVPSHVAFLRILFLNGQKKEQFLDVDDLKLTLQKESRKNISRKVMLRDEMIKLWNIPLNLLENISHELVTPHKKWFKPAAHPAQDILFVSGVSGKITSGRRRDIVELAQRMDIRYKHIPLIPEIKNVVSAYSVYPTYFYPRVSNYTMERFKEIKKLPKVVCFTGVNFKQIPDKNFLSLMENWQKQGVNFLFYRCTEPPRRLLGKPCRHKFAPLLPEMTPGPGRTTRFVKFSRSGKSLAAVVSRNPKINSLIPKAQQKEAQYDMEMPYSFEYPWWDYCYLQDLQVLRSLCGIKGPASFIAAPAGFAVKAHTAFTGTVAVSIENMHREKMLEKKLPVKLNPGQLLTIKDDFELPGGTYVADLLLLDSRNQVVDAGAIRLERKEITPLTVTMKNKGNMVPYPQKAEFTVHAPAAPAQSLIEVEIFNQHREILFTTRKNAAKSAFFAVELPHLRTFFNYIRVKLVHKGKLIAAVTKEFSVPQIPREMNEFYGFINAGASGGAPIKNLGFDFAITGDPRWTHIPYSIRRIRTMGLIPIPRRGDEKYFRPYRGDVKTAPVRTPCFSSPAFHAQLQKDTKFMVENCNLRYNDVNLLWAGDEMFLGRSVCYSPSCLAGFRRRMEKSFGTIGALNKNWGTSFRSFAEVLPQQLDELKDKNHLGPWLDHKMYMTSVFAENFFGKAREELEKYVPNVKIGPTGTQKPGFGYNWHELMKYCRIVGYYSGVQTQVIHDFSDASLMAGQCGGGYTHGHIDYEPYNYNTMWRTLLNGGNLAYHYYGCAINGDGSATRNMVFYTTSLKELKSGIGKVYLSAQPRHSVGILYSQPSLFAAMGSCGQDEWQNSQTSWAKLLDDLRISARFFNYEELAVQGVPKGLKAVVLPFALALSDAEIAALERFSAAGGMVISDCNAGIFDGHGRKRSESKRLEKMKFQTELGFSIARYNFVQLGGTGGELSTSGSGDETFVTLCRKKAAALLKKVNITPFVTLTDTKGKDFGCMAKLRFDGPARIYGFHLMPDSVTPGRFKESDGRKVTVKLDESGHVYDVRNKKYLGETIRWQMNLVPGKSHIYAVVPEKFKSLEVEVPPTAERGRSFRVKTAVAPASGPQVFRLTVTAPDGREMPRYAVNFRSENNSAEKELFFPFNAAKGRYKIRVTHIISSLSCEKQIELR